MSTTTSTGENQKNSRKLQIDSVKANKGKRFSLKNLSLTKWLSKPMGTVKNRII